MSIKNQQIIAGKTGTAAYSSGDIVQAGKQLHLLSFRASDLKPVGLTVGLGISDLAAWGAGLFFDIVVGGKVAFVIDDEICTLTNKEFLPMSIQHNTAIDLYCMNNSTADVRVAAFIRTEQL